MKSITTTDGEFTLELPDGTDVKESGILVKCKEYVARWDSLGPDTVKTDRAAIDKAWNAARSLPQPGIVVGSGAGLRSQISLGGTTCDFIVWDKDEKRFWEFSLLKKGTTLDAKLRISSRNLNISL